MSLLKKVILKLIPKKVKTLVVENELNDNGKSFEYSSMSYAQEGEDLLLNRFLKNKQKGFYVDIGAHHPKRFSNTYYFYKKGWKGINIDAKPQSMVAFQQERPRDTNLEIGISEKRGELMYYMFNEPALNTFSESEALKKDGLRNFKVIEKLKIQTYPLVEILDKYVAIDQKIDFMTIDVEGLDMEVVASNDWEKYRPEIILVEDLQRYKLLELPNKSPLSKMLVDCEYEFVARSFNTMFFKNNRS
ncbi:MAG: FkbM family methyltransferase [Flavobacteriaceae bacterium]|nr:FkbM family methyltransferase [Flavobacteriaceae bacterium]